MQGVTGQFFILRVAGPTIEGIRQRIRVDPYQREEPKLASHHVKASSHASASIYGTTVERSRLGTKWGSNSFGHS